MGGRKNILKEMLLGKGALFLKFCLRPKFEEHIYPEALVKLQILVISLIILAYAYNLLVSIKSIEHNRFFIKKAIYLFCTLKGVQQ